MIISSGIDEITIGELFYVFEFACGVSGYVLGVNPFNQPGVESYKKNMLLCSESPVTKTRKLLLKQD